MRTKYNLLLMTIVLLITSSAYATTITLTGISAVGMTYTQAGSDRSSFAGQFAIASDDPLIANYGYCVEQGVDIWGGEAFVVINDDLKRAEDMSGYYINAAWLMHTYVPQMTEAYQRAALQLAIWDVLYDEQSVGGDGIIDEISGITSSAAQAYFDQIKDDYELNYDVNDVIGKGYKVAYLEWTADSTYNVQDIIVRTVPEPSAMFLFGLGLVGIGAIGRRKL